MKILWFTFEGIGLHVAKRLQDEGNTVLIGQVETYKELGIDKEEDPKDTAMRVSTFNGIIEKKSAKTLLKEASKFEDKDEWSVICDFNNLFAIAEKLKEMGFAGENCSGFVFLPTREQYELESNRDKGKGFVKKHYSIQVGEEHSFKTIDEGITFLEKSKGEDKIWVLKANNDDINALVPKTDDPSLAKDAIISALASDRAGYEMQGYILEEKISQPMELTPQAVFYDGDPVFFDLDIENKPLGAGNNGPQTGCSMNLVAQISQYDPICEISFPPIVYDMAIQHKGLFVWDASILIDARTGKQYFGEFCANRWGWDALFTELSMCESVTDYFQSVMNGRNPLRRPFGASVRMFNPKKDSSKQIIYKSLEGIWLYDVWQNGKKLLPIGYSWDLCVATGAGESIEDATDECYERIEQIEFDCGLIRPKFDFLSQDYPTSITNRYNEGAAKLYMGTPFEAKSVDEKVKVLEKKVELMQKKDADREILVKKQIDEMRDTLTRALEDDS